MSLEVRQRREQALAAEVYISADAVLSKYYSKPAVEGPREDKLATLVIKGFRQVGPLVVLCPLVVALRC